MRRLALTVLSLLALGAPSDAALAQDRSFLGPVDGRELPAVDTSRVGVGEAAPDFILESRDGAFIRLSGFRGRKDVILVFYRGHW